MRRRLALAVIVLLATGGVWSGIEKGNRLYRDGRYGEAVEAYRAALRDGDDSPALRYNLGTALLRLGQYQAAEEHLQAALEAVDPEVRERVHFNLGQRFLEQARTTGEPGTAAELYDAAAEQYRSALRLRPGDMDAKWNYELAVREREEQMRQAGGSPRPDPEARPQGDDGEEDSEPQPRGSGEEPREQPEMAQQPLTPEQAERILSGVEQDERELFRDKLRQGRAQSRPVRDW